MADGYPPPDPKFENNEKVLCYHGQLIYEGKTLKTEFRHDVNEYAYLIHYAGWSKNWDEWVIESQVLKFNDANLDRQKEVEQSHSGRKKSVGRKLPNVKTPVLKKRTSTAPSTSVANNDNSPSVTPTPDSRSNTPIMDQKGGFKMGKRDSISVPNDSTTTDNGEPSRKRKRSDIEKEHVHEFKQDVQIDIPEAFKIFLVDDCDNVVRQNRLVKLPARHTVDQILEIFLKNRKKSDLYAVELCNGLREYFNCMIGSQLLYRYEREQYQEIWNNCQAEEPKKQMSEIYGIAHLLRMFTKLGNCLSYTSLDTDTVNLLQESVEEFLKFILNSYDEYISFEDYGVADPEYQRQVPV